MSRFIKIAATQFIPVEVQTQDGGPAARLRVLKELKQTTQSLKGLGIDLVVTCEAIEEICQSVDQAESLDQGGEMLSHYCEMAQTLKATIAGSIKLNINGHAYNSIVYIGPDGSILGHYNKTYLTQYELEIGLTPGSGAQVVQTPAGILGGAICFDLNFHDLRESYVALKPDIITFSSMYHGGLMQSMWAYQTRSFFASSLPFTGAAILDPFGREQTSTDCYNTNAIATVNLDRVMIHLDFNLEKFDEIRRKYLGEVKISIPANVGSALLYSTSNKRTSMDIAREFELKLLDNYMDSSVKQNMAKRIHPTHQGE